MVRYLTKRLVYMAVTLLVVMLVAFWIIQLHPASERCLNNLRSNEEIRKEFGLDRSLPVRYGMWIKNIFRSLFHNLGYSCYGSLDPVTQKLFKGYLQWTLLLAAGAFILSWLIGIPLGIWSAVRSEAIGDYTIRFFSIFSLGTPVFLLALLITWLANSPDAYSLLKSWGWDLGRVAIAILVITLTQWAILARYLRGYLLDVLSEPYIQAARSKGLPEWKIICKHALRNALHPLLSLMGFWLPNLFESTLAVGIILVIGRSLPLVEVKFWEAINSADQYVILGGLGLLGLILMLGNLLADFALALVDPRIRYE